MSMKQGIVMLKEIMLVKGLYLKILIKSRAISNCIKLDLWI